MASTFRGCCQSWQTHLSGDREICMRQLSQLFHSLNVSLFQSIWECCLDFRDSLFMPRWRRRSAQYYFDNVVVCRCICERLKEFVKYHYTTIGKLELHAGKAKEAWCLYLLPDSLPTNSCRVLHPSTSFKQLRHTQQHVFFPLRLVSHRAPNSNLAPSRGRRIHIRNTPSHDLVSPSHGMVLSPSSLTPSSFMELYTCFYGYRDLLEWRECVDWQKLLPWSNGRLILRLYFC